MDIDDDDAFLYGDPPSPPSGQAGKAPAAAPVKAEKAESSNAALAVAPAPLVPSRVSASLGVSSAMAASLAAYGIDPSAAVVEPALEDGGVEEEDEDEDGDEEDSDDEDDVKMVFTGQTGRALDLRKQQQAPTNVIGIGKWAHTSTGQAPTPIATATPPRPQPKSPVSANQTTEYNPATRPGATSTPVPGSNAYPQIPPAGDSGTAPNILHAAQQPVSAGAPSVPHLSQSNLPPALASSSHPPVDPSNPTGIIPSTGNSVYDLDLAMFEGSGQPWRRPGSDLTDWFNFGFDEASFPKFLRFRAEMEAGRNAMMNAPPMAPITPEVLHMLNLSLPAMINGNVPAQPTQANNFNLNPQMMQQMQQMMSMQGMDMGMMAQMMGNMGGGGGMSNMAQVAAAGQNGQMQGQMAQGQIRPNPGQRPSATPGAGIEAESSEEVKQEEIDPTAEGYVEGSVPPPGTVGLRGRGMMRGVPARGGILRGRGAAPLGPRAAAGIIPSAPKGPKAGRFRDKDRVDSGVSGELDYGGGGGGGGTDAKETESSSAPRRGRSGSGSEDRSRGRSYTASRSSSRSRTSSPEKRRKGSRRSEEDGEYPESKRSARGSRRSESPHGKSSSRKKSGSTRDREREREKEREKERYKERERVKRKRDDGSLSAGLGPGGWGEDGEEVEDRRSRRRRSYSSGSEADGYKTKTASSKRR